MAKAKKLPSGNWRVRLFDGYDDNGKKIYKSFTSGTKKEAEYMAAEYAINRKIYEKPLNMKLGQAIDAYIADSSSILSPSTVRTYKRQRMDRF